MIFLASTSLNDCKYCLHKLINRTISCLNSFPGDRASVQNKIMPGDVASSHHPGNRQSYSINHGLWIESLPYYFL